MKQDGRSFARDERDYDRPGVCLAFCFASQSRQRLRDRFHSPIMGRVPHAGLVPAEESPLAAQLMNVEGPMARTVGDVRLAFGILAGAHPRDPWSLDAPLVHPRVNTAIRVAMVAEPPGGSTDPKIAAVVRNAGAVLSTAGYVCLGVQVYMPFTVDGSKLSAHFGRLAHQIVHFGRFRG